MAVITPNTDLYLLKVPLEIDEVNQLTFADKQTQYNYFNSLPKLGIDDDKFTYQRKDGTIRFSANFDDCIMYNYCMYRNTEYSDKWFYAYITDMQYMNDSVTAIGIKTDVWQTWQFDLNFKPVFVEREHVNDDTLGKHTIPEAFETGEFVVNNTADLLSTEGDELHGGSGTNKTVVVMGVTQLPDGQTLAGVDRIYSGIFQGLYFLVFNDMENPQRVVKIYDMAGQSDAIYCIFLAPKVIFPASTWASYTLWTYTKDGETVSASVYVPATSYGGFANTQVDSRTMSPNYRIIDPDTSLLKYNVDGYEFHNNKMLTYPYCYIYATNNAGGDTVYRWEDFNPRKVADTDNYILNATFRVNCSLSATCSTRLTPMDYKHLVGEGINSEYNYPYGLTGQKFTACSWNSDYYTNWLTQNGVNIGTNLLTSALSTGISAIGNAAYGNVIGMAGNAASLVSTIANTMTKMYEASIVPDQAKGDVNCGDINYSVGKTGYTLQVMSVRREVAEVIDRFWDMFGYKVNTVKIPNITGRRNWNYVKTQGCYIEADIPQGDLDEIKQLFNSGVTFWHNPATFADYSQNNDII